MLTRRTVGGRAFAVLCVGIAGVGFGGSCNDSSEDADFGSTAAEPTTESDSGSTGANETTAADESEGPDALPPRYDVGTIPDAPPPMACNAEEGGGGADPGEPLYSFIWIANSSEGTVSKIDTVTLEEVGRYRTHPEFGDPSRTSVSLNGNVAVANRNGGLVKFYANVADCEDRNGNGVIDTSSGDDDVLDWDEEECRAWFTDFPEFSSQRPVAWTPGRWDPDTCRYENEKVWTSGAHDGGGFGPGEAAGEDFPGVRVVLVDGESGTVERAVKIREVTAGFYGIYGGAVDAKGNFWGSQLSIGHLVRVDLETHAYDMWEMPVSGYGMTVDSQGYVWTCASEVGRFDPDTETWETASVGGSGGCMEDGDGTLWLAGSSLVGVDIETLQVVANYSMPEYVHGVSVDFQGYVWGVSMGTSAYRVDAATGDFESVDGLVGPYTYSDMTGFALANAGGWNPAG